MDSERPEGEEAPSDPPAEGSGEQPGGFRPSWQRLMVWIVIGGIAVWLIISGISGIIAKSG